MSFAIVFTLIFSLSVFSYFAVFGAGGRLNLANSTEAARTSSGLFIFACLVLAIAFRDIRFGVDTFVYIFLYDQYCSGLGSIPFDLSYSSSFGLLKLFSIGSCNSEILTQISAAIICFGLFSLPLKFADKVKVACLLLISTVGIDLATNAIRQGFSVLALVLAAAWFDKRRSVAALFAVAAVVLHPSSALGIIAFGIAQLGFRYFVVALLALSALVVNYSLLGLSIPLADLLIYQIDKYAAHEGSELLVRLLSAAQLSVPLLAVLVTGAVAKHRLDADGRQKFGKAMRLALTAVPFLFLPYFGYRYVYGIYPIVLLLCLPAMRTIRRPAFELAFAATAALTLAWAYGSTVTRTAHFIG